MFAETARKRLPASADNYKLGSLAAEGVGEKRNESCRRAHVEIWLRRLMREEIYSVCCSDTSRCSTVLCSVETSRSSTGSCCLDTYVQVQLRPL